MYPYYRSVEDHPFSMVGLEIGDNFFGCIKCGYQTHPEVKACILECPHCLSRMTDYVVTEGDLK